MQLLDHLYPSRKQRKHYQAFITFKIIFSPTSMNNFLVVYYLYVFEFFWNNINCWICYNNVKDQSEEICRRCSVKKVLLKFRKIHRKTPMPECLFY